MVTMYNTMMPLIFGGVLNMVFTKTPLYKKAKTPIDAGKTFRGKRIFGDNKTVIGFISMIVFCCISQVAWGLLNHYAGWDQYNESFNRYGNTVLYNVILGLIYGFVYMISELPNSFVKRQLDIEAGKTDKGFKGFVFFLVDQIDSLVGVMAVLWIVAGFPFWKYLAYVALGGATHILINVTLYKLHIRKNL